MSNTRRLVAAAVVGSAATAVFGAPQPATADTVTVTQVWSRTFPGVTFRESSPTPVNLTTPGVAVGALDGKVYSLDLTDGTDEPGWPVNTGSPVSGSPSAVDLAGSGNDTVFIGAGTAATTEASSCSGGGTFAFQYRGTLIWHNTGSDGSCPDRPFQSSFALGDITGSGQADATIGELGLYSPSYVANSGVMLSGWPYHADDTVFSTAALADVDGDGVPDVVMGGDSSPGGVYAGRGGLLRAVNGIGQTIWNFVIDEQVRSSPAVGNLDGSGPLIVFGTGIKWIYSGGAHDSTSLFAVDFAGHLRWREDLGGLTIASPALADVAGNGQLDAIEGTDGSPGSSRATIWVFDPTGKALPQWAGHPSDGGAIIGGITTADLNGDGAQDLIVPTGAGIWAYDGRTGQTLFSLDTGQASFQSSPLVTDDGGGAIGITIAGTRPDGNGVIEHYRVGGRATLGARGWPMFHHDARHTGNVAPPPLTDPGGRIAPVAGAPTAGPPPPQPPTVHGPAAAPSAHPVAPATPPATLAPAKSPPGAAANALGLASTSSLTTATGVPPPTPSPSGAHGAALGPVHTTKSSNKPIAFGIAAGLSAIVAFGIALAARARLRR